MRQAGKLVQWHDARGFGFIEGPDRQRIFVHITQIARIATRPRPGDALSFTVRTGRDGRIEAVDVRIAGANPLPDRSVLQRGLPAPPRRIGWQIVVALILSALLVVALGLGRAPLWLLLPYGMLGAISFLLYRTDKHRAETGAWRVSEATLLGIDLAGGIIGGLSAQALFRHKTSKASYVASVAVLAAVHGMWLAGMATGALDVAELAGLARDLCAQVCG